MTACSETGNINKKWQNFNESIFIHRFTFLVLNSFTSGYFSKKFQKLSESIGLHLHGEFSFIAFVFFKLWHTLQRKRDFLIYAFCYPFEHNLWDLNFIAFLFCMMFSIKESKVDTNFNLLYQAIPNYCIKRSRRHKWSAVKKILICPSQFSMKTLKKHLFKTWFTCLVYISLYFLQ